MEQLAAVLLEMLSSAERFGTVTPAEIEEAPPEALQEGMFRHVMMWMRDKPRPGDYFGYLCGWLAQPWSRGMALLHRAAVGVRTKCYAQAAADADDAIAFYAQARGALTPHAAS